MFRIYEQGRVKRVLSYRAYLSKMLGKAVKDLHTDTDGMRSRVNGLEGFSLDDVCGVCEYVVKNTCYFYEFAYFFFCGKYVDDDDRFCDLDKQSRARVKRKIKEKRLLELRVDAQCTHSMAIPLPWAMLGNPAEGMAEAYRFWRTPYWICQDVCVFLIGTKERLVDFLAKVSQAKDIRELVAGGVIAFCEHTRHVREWKHNEVLSALEKKSNAIGENDGLEKLLDLDKDGGLFERFLSFKA